MAQSNHVVILILIYDFSASHYPIQDTLYCNEYAPFLEKDLRFYAMLFDTTGRPKLSVRGKKKKAEEKLWI